LAPAEVDDADATGLHDPFSVKHVKQQMDTGHELHFEVNGLSDSQFDVGLPDGADFDIESDEALLGL